MNYILVVAWLLCSFVSYGLIFDTFTKGFPYMKNIAFSVIISLIGPAGIFAVLWLIFWLVR